MGLNNAQHRIPDGLDPNAVISHVHFIQHKLDFIAAKQKVDILHGDSTSSCHAMYRHAYIPYIHTHVHTCKKYEHQIQTKRVLSTARRPSANTVLTSFSTRHDSRQFVYKGYTSDRRTAAVTASETLRNLCQRHIISRTVESNLIG